MAKNKYVGDYRLLEYIDEKGRFHNSYEYIGADYVFSASRERRKREAIIAAFGCAVMWLLFIGALFLNSMAMRSFYISFPYAFTALPLASFTGCFGVLMGKKEKLERRESERLMGKYPDSLIWTAVLSGYSFLASAIRFAISDSRLIPGDILFPIFSMLLAAAALLLYRRRGTFASFPEA